MLTGPSLTIDTNMWDPNSPVDTFRLERWNSLKTILNNDLASFGEAAVVKLGLLPFLVSAYSVN